MPKLLMLPRLLKKTPKFTFLRVHSPRWVRGVSELSPDRFQYIPEFSVFVCDISVYQCDAPEFSGIV